MAGEGHFKGGRKNSHPRAGAIGGENKGGFGKIELQCQRLHLGVAETGTGFKYAEGITAKD